MEWQVLLDKSDNVPWHWQPSHSARHSNNFNVIHQNNSVHHAYCWQLETRVESSSVGLEKERSFPCCHDGVTAASANRHLKLIIITSHCARTACNYTITLIQAFSECLFRLPVKGLTWKQKLGPPKLKSFSRLSFSIILPYSSESLMYIKISLVIKKKKKKFPICRIRCLGVAR